jgi:hypothetical protein
MRINELEIGNLVRFNTDHKILRLEPISLYHYNSEMMSPLPGGEIFLYLGKGQDAGNYKLWSLARQRIFFTWDFLTGLEVLEKETS